MDVDGTRQNKSESTVDLALNTFVQFKQHIDQVLNNYLPCSTNEYHHQVIEAMRYSFEVGGKRIRPMLMYGAYQLCRNTTKTTNDSNHELIEAFMAAMEMIHTYSLIHDDLPAMDNDDLRRGKPTCHIKFGEANAILAGDGLLNYAFELVLSKCMLGGYGQIDVLKAMYELAKSSGVYGMIGGQSADMYFESHELTNKEQLDYIHQHKTGAIITSSLIIGGILAGADSDVQEILQNIGNSIGMAFQIQDDILDCTSTAEVLGKPIGSDLKNNKKTYVTFAGIEQSKKDVLSLLTAAKEDVILLKNKQQKLVDVENNLLNELIDFLITRNY